jgi:5-methylcytosine-specific restriction endonuclease McrA
MKSYKVCTRCKGKKIVSDFTVNRANPDGLDYYCKVCSSEKRKTLARKNGSMYLDSKVGYNESDAHLYIVGECEICRKSFYPIRSNHKRCDICSYVAHDIVHHSLTGERKYNKGFRRKVIPSVVVEVSKRYVSACACCYCSRSFTDNNPKSIDHIIPICLGGGNESNNINICCLECNKAKAGLPLDKWISLCRLVSNL